MGDPVHVDSRAGFTRNFSLLGPLNQPLNQSYERCSPQLAGCASKNHPIGNLPPVIMTWVCLRLVFLIQEEIYRKYLFFKMKPFEQT